MKEPFLGSRPQTSAAELARQKADREDYERRMRDPSAPDRVRRVGGGLSHEGHLEADELRYAKHRQDYEQHLRRLEAVERQELEARRKALETEGLLQPALEKAGLMREDLRMIALRQYQGMEVANLGKSRFQQLSPDAQKFILGQRKKMEHFIEEDTPEAQALDEAYERVSAEVVEEINKMVAVKPSEGGWRAAE